MLLTLSITASVRFNNFPHAYNSSTISTNMNASFFQTNRDKIVGVTLDGLIILSGHTQVQRSNDAAFNFEQEANFWWLTGIESPDWWVIIDSTKHKSWLVMPNVGDVHQIFDGSLSADQARSISGITDIISDEQAQAFLWGEAKKNRTVYTLGEDPHVAHYDFALNPAPVKMIEKLKGMFDDVKDCRHDLAELRAIKQPAEIQSIRDAIELTIQGFEKVKSIINDYSFEYEIEAEFDYYFRKNGASGHAYDPIVAAGKNACTLHYSKNRDKLVDGELILLDVGARMNGYPADITRTYAYGDVSERHKAVHKEVEMAHHQIIQLLRPGLSVKAYFSSVDEIMHQALKNVGLLKKESDYRKYFPHSISHGLGIDVHDSLGGPETFQPGMILTVEPGIYIPEEGIGVRIEDDILITATGHENLSKALPTSL